MSRTVLRTKSHKGNATLLAKPKQQCWEPNRRPLAKQE